MTTTVFEVWMTVMLIGFAAFTFYMGWRCGHSPSEPLFNLIDPVAGVRQLAEELELVSKQRDDLATLADQQVAELIAWKHTAKSQEGLEDEIKEQAERIAELTTQRDDLQQADFDLGRAEARLAAMRVEATKLMAAKGSYDAIVDPRVQREYEAMYGFIQALAQGEAGEAEKS